MSSSVLELLMKLQVIAQGIADNPAFPTGMRTVWANLAQQIEDDLARHQKDMHEHQ